MPMLAQGAKQALDRIFKTSTVEQIQGVPEPEQMARLPQPLPRLRLRGQPRSVMQPSLVTEERPQATEPVDFQVKTEDGEEITLTLRPDRSVYSGDTLVGQLSPDGTFVPREPTLGQKLLSATLTGVDVAFAPFKQVGMVGRGTLIESATPEQKELDAQFKKAKAELDKEYGVTPTYNPAKFLRTEEGKEYLTRIAELREEWRQKGAATSEAERGERATKAYEERPWWEQLLWEAPAFGGAAKLGATTVRGALAGTTGKLAKPAAQVGRAALMPIAAAEQAPGALLKLAGKGARAVLGKPVTQMVRRAGMAPEAKAAVDKLTNVFKGMKGEQFERAAAVHETRAGMTPGLAELQEQYARKEITYAAFRKQRDALLRTATPVTGERAVAKAGFTIKDMAELERYIASSPVLEGRPLRMSGFQKDLAEILGFARGPNGKPLPARPPRKNEIEMIKQVFGEELGLAMEGKSILGRQAWNTFIDAIGVPRLLKTIADVSGILRQNILLGMDNPALLARKGARSVKQFFSADDFSNQMKMIKAHPEYAHAVDHGLEFIEIGGAAARRAEGFMTKFSKWVPLARQSERAMVGVSNSMKFDTYFNYRAMYGKALSDVQYKQLANVINAMGGRGTLGPVNSIAPFLNTLLFSPRFIAGQFEAGIMPIFYYNNPAVRRLALRCWSRFIGMNVGLMGMGKATGLWDVEFDPRSSNFGRARIGDVRLDLWQGYLPWIRLLARLISGQTKTQAGVEKEVNRLDALIHTGRGKLAPVPGLVADLLQGRTYVGEDMETYFQDLPKALREQLLPMAVQDIWDAVETDGFGGGLLAVPGLAGANVAAYPSRVFDTWADTVGEHMGKRFTIDQLIEMRPAFNEAQGSWVEYEDTPSGMKHIYLQNNPEVDASRYFWGASKSVQTPEARDIVLRMVKEYGIPEDSLPIREAEEYKPGKPEEDLASFMSALPSSMKEYLWDKQDEWEKKELPVYVKQIREWKVSDQRLIDHYELLMKGEPTAKRTAYRVRNPELDAALAFWNHVGSVQTGKARTILEQRMKTLGIPTSVIRALAPKATSGALKLRSK